MFRKSNDGNFVLNQSLDRYVDFIQSPRPCKWLLVHLVQSHFYCQDEARHAFIAKTVAAMLSLPILGQPCFHRQDGSSHAFIAKMSPAMLSSPRWEQPRFHMPKTGATTLSSPGRGQPYFHCQDRGSHAFIAKTRPAMLSLPWRAATLFLPPHSWDSTEIDHKDV